MSGGVTTHRNTAAISCAYVQAWTVDGRKIKEHQIKRLDSICIWQRWLESDADFILQCLLLATIEKILCAIC